MTAQGGFGVVLKITVGTVLTAVVGLLETDFPKFSKVLAESTGHDSATGYYESTATGKRRTEPFSCTIAWDSAAATHAAVQAAFESDDPVAMSIEDPDGDETISGNAHIAEIQRMSDQEDIVKAEVMIEPTGEWDIA